MLFSYRNIDAIPVIGLNLHADFICSGIVSNNL